LRHPALPFIAPFVTFVALMEIEKAMGLPTTVMYPLRVAAVAAVLLLFSRQPLSARPTRPLASAAIGAVVFAMWIGPDVVFGPGYRHSRLFQNAFTGGGAVSSLPIVLHTSAWFLAVRAGSCALLVPPMEELFWRGWAMRWIVASDFRRIPLGTYQAVSFWLVALLFAAEHGPYWEVGLAAGIIYNWWMVRTRSLWDCSIAHAVTNGLLSGYILATHQFQYWL
jgi:CAAX prenyl protease-like protein